jgi:hypothetical protein
MSSFIEPENIYARISELNSSLTNCEKWALTSSAMDRIDAPPYKPTNKYTIWPTEHEFGQISELRKVLPLFFIKMPVYEENVMYPSCHRLLVMEFSQYCEQGFSGPSTDNEVYQLIPLPQRHYMSFTSFVWVVALLLESYQYQFWETDGNHVAWYRECTHEYFRFYARRTNPTKLELQEYQEYRKQCGEQFNMEKQSFVHYNRKLNADNNYSNAKHITLSRGDTIPSWWELRPPYTVANIASQKISKTTYVSPNSTTPKLSFVQPSPLHKDRIEWLLEDIRNIQRCYVCNKLIQKRVYSSRRGCDKLCCSEECVCSIIGVAT